MLRSLFNGVSGLRSHQARMDVIGNNIANVNTIGFKVGRMTFEETLAQTLQGATRPPGDHGGINPMQIGLGTSVGGIDTLFTQGNIESTGQVTDLAIQGSGFFVLSDGTNRLYSRAGAFQFDADGKLVSPNNGWILQGQMAVNGEIPSGTDIEDIQLPFGQKAPAKATTSISYTGNLDAGEEPTASIFDGQALLAQANGTDKLTDMYNTSGEPLGIEDTNSVVFQTDATAETSMLGLSNSSGVALDLLRNDDVVVEINGSTTTAYYDDTGTGVIIKDLDAANATVTASVGDSVTISANGVTTTLNLVAKGTDTGASGGDFSTFLEFAEELQSFLNSVTGGTGVSTSVQSDGSILIDNGSTTDISNLTITSSNTSLANALGGTLGNISQNAQVSTHRLILHKSYRAGVDFDTMTEFATKVQEVISRASTGATIDATTVGNAFTLDNSLGDANLNGISISSEDRVLFNQAMTGIIDDIAKGSVGTSEKLIYKASFSVGSDFETLDELADKLSAAFQHVSSGSKVSFSDGKFCYDNSTGTSDLKNVTITGSPSNSRFQRIMDISSTLKTTDSADYSMLFLDTADENDKLINLYNASGSSMGLAVSDDITLLSGTVGSQSFTNTNIISNLGAGTTYGQFRDALKTKLFGSNPVHGETVEIDSDGSLKITGAKGEDNKISGLSFGSGPNTGDNTNSVFSAAFTMNEVQAAEDVTHATSITTYDSLGDQHSVKMTFTKTDTEGLWTWELSVDEPAEIVGGSTGKISFSSDGTLKSFTYDGGASFFEFDPKTGADNVKITIDPGEIGTSSGISNFSSPSTTVATGQDGYPMGNLNSITINDSGVITGTFTNGTNQTLAQIALAAFNNPGGLLRVGDNMYQTTGNSGEAVIGIPGKSIQSKLTPGALEMSNVDLAQEFTSMIVAQRGFQANARVITTSDNMLTELVNLKR